MNEQQFVEYSPLLSLLGSVEQASQTNSIPCSPHSSTGEALNVLAWSHIVKVKTRQHQGEVLNSLVNSSRLLCFWYIFKVKDREIQITFSLKRYLATSFLLILKQRHQAHRAFPSWCGTISRVNIFLHLLSRVPYISFTFTTIFRLHLAPILDYL